jgi:hypothetical protein
MFNLRAGSWSPTAAFSSSTGRPRISYGADVRPDLGNA